MKQTKFRGLTGTVKFDHRGMRTAFSLDVLEVSVSRGLAKVGRRCLFGVTFLLTHCPRFVVCEHSCKQKKERQLRSYLVFSGLLLDEKEGNCGGFRGKRIARLPSLCLETWRSWGMRFLKKNMCRIVVCEIRVLLHFRRLCLEISFSEGLASQPPPWAPTH